MIWCARHLTTLRLSDRVSSKIFLLTGNLTTVDWPDTSQAAFEPKVADESILVNVPARLAICSPLPLNGGAGVAVNGPARSEQSGLIVIANGFNVFRRDKAQDWAAEEHY